MRRIGMIFGSTFAAAAGIGAAFLLAGQARAGGAEIAPCDVTVTVADVCMTTSTSPTTTAGSTTETTTTTTSPTSTATTTEQTTTIATTAATTTVSHHQQPHHTAHRRRQSRHRAAAPPTPAPPPAFIVPHVAPPLHGGPYVFPVYGPVSFADGFGSLRPDRLSWDHGTDIFAPLGAPVVAVSAGTLFRVGWNQVGGNRFWLRDRAGNFFFYSNLSAFSSLALSGVRVSAGTVLGFVGNTGNARGMPYRLHFEVHPAGLLSTGYDASAVDPVSYLRAWRAAAFRRLSSVAARFRIPAAAAQPVAKKPVRTAGAVLVQADDISRASGLSPGSFRVTLRVRPPKVNAKQIRAVTRVVPVFATGPEARKWGEEALLLDTGVTAPEQTTVWDRLSRCEAGGDWSENSGNGFYGGLQFTAGTWVAYGGAEFAPSAEQATREQQIIVARRVLAKQGWSAWPACSLKLGLRR